METQIRHKPQQSRRFDLILWDQQTGTQDVTSCYCLNGFIPYQTTEESIHIVPPTFPIWVSLYSKTKTKQKKKQHSSHLSGLCSFRDKDKSQQL